MEQVQMEYWKMDIWKVNDFEMKNLRDLQAGGAKIWLM